MEYSYFYRKHIKYIRKSIPYILGALYLFTISGLLLNFMGIKTMPRFMVIMSIVLSLSLSIALIPNWFVMRRFERIRVTISENHIYYRNINDETIIPIDSITKLSFSSIKYTGGWIKITSPNKTIRLTVVLGNSGELISRLKNALDQRDMSTVYDRKKLFNYYKTAVFADQSWERLYNYVGIIFGGMAVNFVICIYVMCNNNFSKHFNMLPFYLFTFLYVVGEYIVAIKTGRSADEEKFTMPSRNHKFEKKVFIICIIIFCLITAAWSYLVFYPGLIFIV